MRRLSLDEIVRSAKQKAERLANRGGSFSRLRGPLWSIFDDCADEVAAINDRERRFRCCLELMSVCKDVGVMPSCASSCIFTLCSAIEDTLLHWPAECEDDCATLRGLTIKLHSAIGRLAEGGGWGEDETAALMKNWFTDAPEEVRFLPWDPGTEIEWSSDSSCKSWRAAVVVDRWHLRDTLRQEAMLANIPPGQLRLAATTTADERAAAVRLRASGTVLSAGGAVDAAKFPPVSIEMGRQKYVLIRLLTEPVMHLVRGVCDAEYHKDAAAGTAAALTDAGIGFTILGGGRIEASPSSISIFGFSYGFPWDGGPRHDLTAELCRGAYPDAKIEVSDSGY
jgi:hypothetical protein